MSEKWSQKNGTGLLRPKQGRGVYYISDRDISDILLKSEIVFARSQSRVTPPDSRNFERAAAVLRLTPTVEYPTAGHDMQFIAKIAETSRLLVPSN
ncbi:MAG TPA: hypothetical protein VN765_14015 [Candidatus Acidoferrum sp.]|nr:hypothetical protein [Candidatus Acidoferrum sp.]